MARSFSKKTLDERFEAFLKESVGSEDDSERVSRFFTSTTDDPDDEAPSRDDKPWWASGADTDTSGDVGNKGASKFLKSKQPAAVSGESSPPPPTRVDERTIAASATVAPGGVSSRVAVHIPVSESLQTKDSLDESNPSRGGGSFGTFDAGGTAASSALAGARELPSTMESGSVSLGDGSLPFAATMESSSGGLVGGDDTMEEMAEKRRFFEKLEADAGGSVDYARLNNALDLQATVTSAENTPPRPPYATSTSAVAAAAAPNAKVASATGRQSGLLQPTSAPAVPAATHRRKSENSSEEADELPEAEDDGSEESAAAHTVAGQKAAEKAAAAVGPQSATGLGPSGRPPLAASSTAAAAATTTAGSAGLAALPAPKPSLLANVSLRDTMSTLAATTDKLHGLDVATSSGGGSGMEGTSRTLLVTKPPTFGYTTSQEMEAVREAAEYVLREGSPSSKGGVLLTEDWSETASVDAGSPAARVVLRPPAAASSPSAAVTTSSRMQLPAVALSIADDEPSPLGSPARPELSSDRRPAIAAASATTDRARSKPLSPITKDGGDVWALRALEEDEGDEDDDGSDVDDGRRHRSRERYAMAGSSNVDVSSSALQPKSHSSRRQRRKKGSALSSGDGMPQRDRHRAASGPRLATGAGRSTSPGSPARRSSGAVRFAHVASSGYGKRLPIRAAAAADDGEADSGHARHDERRRSAVGSREASFSPVRSAAVSSETTKERLQLYLPERDPGATAAGSVGRRPPASTEDVGNTAVPGSPSKARPSGSGKTAPTRGDGVVHGMNAKGKVKDHGLMSSVESFAAYIQTHFARASDKWVPPVDTQHHDAAGAPERSLAVGSTAAAAAAAAAAAEDALRRELREWIERWEDEKRLNTVLSSRVQEMREQTQQQLAEQQTTHEAEVLELKREVATSKAKLAAQTLEVRMPSGQPPQPAVGGRRTGGGGSPIDGDHPAAVDVSGAGGGAALSALVDEQERLLEGYQRENERLYAELKKAAAERKVVEEGLVRDNHRLAGELAMLREQLEAKEAALRARRVVHSPRAEASTAHHQDMGPAVVGAGRIAELSADLKQAKARASKLQDDLDRLTKERDDLDHRAAQLAAERDRLLEAATGRQQSAAAQASLEAEVERLSRKVRWYAENQELLDRDAQRLKEKDAAIEALREQLRNAQSEAGQKRLETKAKAKEKSADAKRIQDLERQVKELEGILRKRNPNSLPALMMAAAAAAGDSTPDHAGAQPPAAVRFLEDRLRRLERELEGKDDECKLALRAAEQRLSALREKYDERIAGLEQELSAVRSHSGERPYSTASALQRELDAVREGLKKKLADAQQENEALRAELEATRQRLQNVTKADAAAARQAAAEWADKLKEAELALDRKHAEYMQLLDAIERQQLDKRQLLAELDHARQPGLPLLVHAAAAPSAAQAEAKRPAAHKRPIADSGKARADRPAATRVLPSVGSAFSRPTALAAIGNDAAAVLSRGDYAPQNFAAQHVDDVLREKERLHEQVERLELDLSQQRVDHQRALAELEASRRREHEQLLDELSALKRAHQVEIDKLVADHAAFNSSSKVTELSCKVEAQEVIIRHLKEDRDRWRTDADELAASRIRELTLRADLERLKTELDDAKRFHSPEMRHYETLIRKISDIEARNAQRERDIRLVFAQQISAGSSLFPHGGDRDSDATRLQHLLRAKQLQIESFRAELDSILNILRDLKRSGASLPADAVLAKPALAAF